MTKEYLTICINEGLSEEQIRKIDNVLDADKKRLKRRKKAGMEENFQIISLTEMTENSDLYGEYDIYDEAADFEAEMSVGEDLKLLNSILSELSSEDREIIIAYYGVAKMNAAEAGRMFGINKDSANYKVKRILSFVTERFFELNPSGETDIFTRP